MRAAFFATLLVAATASATERGSVALIRSVSHFERSEIDATNRNLSLSGAAKCDVSVLQLTYESVGVRGEPATLSAGLYVPRNCDGRFPILAEAHGTQTDRDIQTAGITAGENSITFFAAQGYVVVATDYLGLGQSDYPYHPYLHASSEASAVIDAIRAARQAAARLAVPTTGQVMLFGYSQGGHATMAAQREIERQHANEIQLAATAPMSGPYSLSQTFLGAWFGQTAGADNIFASELLAYAVASYRRIYPNTCAELANCIAPPYVDAVAKLFPSTQHLSEIRRSNVLPPGRELNRLRVPAFTAAFMLDEQQPFRQALKHNDVLDWTPATPMLLCGSRRDAIVDFNNTLAAQATFAARGVQVPMVDVADQIPAGATGSDHHGYAVPLCYAAARDRLFDGIKQQPPKLSSSP